MAEQEPITVPRIGQSAETAADTAARTQELLSSVTMAGGQRQKTTVAIGEAISPSGKPVRLIAATTPLKEPVPRPTEVFVPFASGHAEIQLIQFAEKNGYTLREIHPSRAFCPNCGFWTRFRQFAPPEAKVWVARGVSVPLSSLSDADLGVLASAHAGPKYPAAYKFKTEGPRSFDVDTPEVQVLREAKTLLEKPNLGSRGFISIGNMVFVLVTVGSVVYALSKADTDKLGAAEDVLKETLAQAVIVDTGAAALGAAVGAASFWAGFALGLGSDSDREKEKAAIVYRFIKNRIPAADDALSNVDQALWNKVYGQLFNTEPIPLHVSPDATPRIERDVPVQPGFVRLESHAEREQEARSQVPRKQEPLAPQRADVASKIYDAIGWLGEYGLDVKATINSLLPRVLSIMQRDPAHGVVLDFNYLQKDVPWYSLSRPKPQLISITPHGETSSILDPDVDVPDGYRLVRKYKTIPPLQPKSQSSEERTKRNSQEQYTGPRGPHLPYFTPRIKTALNNPITSTRLIHPTGPFVPRVGTSIQAFPLSRVAQIARMNTNNPVRLQQPLQVEQFMRTQQQTAIAGVRSQLPAVIHLQQQIPSVIHLQQQVQPSIFVSGPGVRIIQPWGPSR